MKSPSGKNVIGYALKGAGNRFFVGINTTDGSEIPNTFIQATAAEIEEACALAHQAFVALQNVVLEDRLHFIALIVEEIKSREKELIHFMTLETGLPEARAKVELKRSVYQFQQYAQAVADGSALEVKIDEPDPSANGLRTFDLRKFNVPLGPVAVFGASNFPFAYSTLGGDVASALAAGCPVIVKAHPMHPNTAALSAECIINAAKRSEMPDGIFSQLNGVDISVGQTLVQHPMVKAVGFTGSIQGGTALMKLAAARKEPIPVYAEMGSVNPVICCADALDERAEDIARVLSDSISTNAGQFCTSPGIVFVENGPSAEVFKQQLMQRLLAVAPQVMLGANIAGNYQKRKEEISASFTLSPEGSKENNTITPAAVTVKCADFITNPVLHEEVFGAFVCVVECEGIAEIANALEVLEGQLTGSLFTNSKANFEQLSGLLQRKVGRIIFNGVPTGVEVSRAQQHGGPFPSSSSPQTSVGHDAVKRFLRPVAFQNGPEEWLLGMLRK